MEYITPLLLLAVGLGLLIWGSESLIKVARYLAKRFNLSPLVAGAIILGFGTSLPELGVSVSAVISDTPLVAYGNVIGSNIANIGLILGLSACLCAVPIVFTAQEARYQFILVAAATMLFLLFASDLVLTPSEAILLLMLFVVSMVIMARTKSQIDEDDEIEAMKLPRLIFSIVGGIACVGFGAPLTVDAASQLAYNLGASEQLVSLTLVAFGTSLPELIVSIQLATIKKPRLIIGNIMGSNIFNILLVLPVVHLFKPLQLEKEELYRDGGFLAMITILFIALCFSWKGQRQIHKLLGALFLAIYCAYLAIIAVKMFVL